MLQQVVPRQENYSQNRATALHNVESTISELGGILRIWLRWLPSKAKWLLGLSFFYSSHLLYAALNQYKRGNE